MLIGEVAVKCGLNIDTIRYYERAGICPAIDRGPDGKRRFSKENLDWLILLASLRETGMSTKKMRHFAVLYQQGDATVVERKEILRAHEKHLEVQQLQLAKCRELLTYKLARYEEILGDNQ